MDPDVYADFATAAELRGLRPSSLVHHFAVQVIHEERGRNAQVFELIRDTVKERIARNSAAKKKSTKARGAKVRDIEKKPGEAA